MINKFQSHNSPLFLRTLVSLCLEYSQYLNQGLVRSPTDSVSFNEQEESWKALSEEKALS